jgi:nitrogen fixation/metabolism regulation signal transduction histidine kinase
MYQPNPEQQELFVAALIAMALTLLIVLVLTIPLALFLSIRHTHRIVGPMKRIEKALEAIGQGDFSKCIILREGDALEDLAKAINKMAENLRQRAPS